MAVVYQLKDFEEVIDASSDQTTPQMQSGNTDSGAGSSSTIHREEKLTEAQIQLNNFFPQVLEEVKKIKTIEPGNQVLPLARIKKIMKLDEDVKMISAEAPLLFAKATEIFIHELTLRAWIHTEDNKRRTLQRNDIAMAISKYDQFDFLIDIVPREEMKTKREPEKPTASSLPPDQQQSVVYVVQPPQQPTHINTIPTMTAQSPPQTIQLQANGIPTSPQQSIMITQPATSQTQHLQQLQLQNQQQLIHVPTAAGNQLQFLQQVVTPSGEISQIPIPLTAQQLNLLRAQMGQPIIQIQAPQTIFQTQSGQNIAIPINMQGGLFLNAAGQLQQQTIQTHHQQQQQQQQVQQQQQQVKDE